MGFVTFVGYFAPTCYRDPGWPDPEFPQKKNRKMPSGPKLWNLKKIPSEYQKNFPKREFFRIFGTEYDRAKVPPYNGNDPPPAPGNLKALLFPPASVNKVQNKGTQGVRARYDAELPLCIYIYIYMFLRGGVLERSSP